MQLSKSALRIKPSATLAIAAKARQLKEAGHDVVSLATGEPDFVTPQAVINKAKESLDRGDTHYCATPGLAPLRKAIVEKLKRDNGLDYDLDEIVVTPGAKILIYNAIKLLVNNDEEVIFQTPYWVSYPAQADILGCKSVIIETDASTDYKLTVEKLEKAITPKTRALILNSPSNPSGMVYSKDELTQIAKICIDNNITVISDEIYEKLVFDGEKHISIAELPGMQERTVLVNGLSKAYAMTGWRLGYVAAPKDFITKMKSLVGQQTTCVPQFIQEAAITAIRECDDEVEKMRVKFQERRDLFIAELSKITDIIIKKPLGAFYIWVDVSSYLRSREVSSLELAEFLIDKKHLAVVPGEAFGSPGFLRLSFAASDEDIVKGAKRLKEGLEEL